MFTEDETKQFLENALGEQVNDDLVTKLSERTENWPAGLRLTSLALRNQADAAIILEEFPGSKQQIMGYLLDEVLMRQPQAIQNFLLHTSILDRFCAPLYDALNRGFWHNPSIWFNPGNSLEVQSKIRLSICLVITRSNLLNL